MNIWPAKVLIILTNMKKNAFNRAKIR